MAKSLWQFCVCSHLTAHMYHGRDGYCGLADQDDTELTGRDSQRTPSGLQLTGVNFSDRRTKLKEMLLSGNLRVLSAVFRMLSVCL